jgi:hypothetical protein
MVFAVEAHAAEASYAYIKYFDIYVDDSNPNYSAVWVELDTTKPVTTPNGLVAPVIKVPVECNQGPVAHLVYKDTGGTSSILAEEILSMLIMAQTLNKPILLWIMGCETDPAFGAYPKITGASLSGYPEWL